MAIGAVFVIDIDTPARWNVTMVAMIQGVLMLAFLVESHRGLTVGMVQWTR